MRQLQAHPLSRGGPGLTPAAGEPGEPAGPAARLAAIERRIAAACARGRRDPATVTLVGASKTQPAAALAPFVAAGLAVLGENRVQEAQAKRRELGEILGEPHLEWHLIGPLQTNKARPALELFSCIHSLDRPEIAAALDREAGRRGVRPAVFVEVNLGGEPSKHGFPPGRLAEAVLPLAALPNLRVVGLMAIPPPAAAAEGSRPWFRRLRELRDDLGSRPEWAGWPGSLSMGMSDDFEEVIEEGATHVRVGTALFGPRKATPGSGGHPE
ncbi:MAG TPA: YggS family pyridoxal phosphate-dependent enzyme [Thermoanaerobaculia bacterium]|nr:YggS family pyridoxal phosphate-dependent enzyme [Thermoanaerobaculia bacterium]